jgi:hypothetical protein
MLQPVSLLGASQQSIHDSLITMLSRKCTEMAALADQEAARRQTAEVQLT